MTTQKAQGTFGPSRRRFVKRAAAMSGALLYWTSLVPSVAGEKTQDPLSGDPFLEQTDLFEAHSEGYTTYRIPTLAVSSKGTLLALCEARKGEGGDWSDIDILM